MMVLWPLNSSNGKVEKAKPNGAVSKTSKKAKSKKSTIRKSQPTASRTSTSLEPITEDSFDTVDLVPPPPTMEEINQAFGISNDTTI